MMNDWQKWDAYHMTALVGVGLLALFGVVCAVILLAVSLQGIQYMDHCNVTTITQGAVTTVTRVCRS